MDEIVSDGVGTPPNADTDERNRRGRDEEEPVQRGEEHEKRIPGGMPEDAL